MERRLPTQQEVPASETESDSPRTNEALRLALATDTSKQLPLPAEAPLLYQPNEGVDPVAFLQKHYGRCLSYFGAEENLLFQDQLRKLDTPLLIAVTNRLQYMRRRGGHNLPLREVLPTRSDRLTMEIQQATRQELETNPRLAAVVAMRARRAEEK